MRILRLISKHMLIVSFLALAGVIGYVSLSTADGTGQIEGGNIYLIKNLTQNSSYSNPASANACDELEYSVRLHNSGFTAVNNINVTATLPTGASTSNTSDMTATYTGGVVASTSASATVNISSAQSLSYENGTAKLFDDKGNVLQTLPDTINSSGVNVGNLDGSTTEFLNFKVKISCPTPTPPVFSCDSLSASAGDNRTATITAFNVTAKNGATFTKADINWGDGNTDSGLTSVVGKTHQYSADGTFEIAATAHFTVNGQDVTADGANCMATVKFSTPGSPVFTCNNLSVTAGDNRTVTVSNFATTAQNGATFKDAVINWGDNSNTLTSDHPVGHTHQYSQDGSFTIVATAHFTVNGQDETASGPACTQVVTFQSNQPPTVTPPPAATPVATSPTSSSTPTELVNTGPGSLVALFAAVMSLGTLAYRYVLTRKLNS